MKPRTAIVLVLMAGAAGFLIWYLRRNSTPTSAIAGPGIGSGFKYSITPTVPQVRTRPPDAPIIGIAVPRTTTPTPIVSTRGGGSSFAASIGTTAIAGPTVAPADDLPTLIDWFSKPESTGV